MTTILTKKKDTTGAPAPGDLTNAAGGAELAVNTFDKRLYTKDSGGNVVEIGTNPTILNIDNIEINGNTISSTNSNGNIVLAPNGTGQLVVNAGTVGAPIISPTGDSNTGIFFPAADTIAFTEGGVESGRFTSTGALQLTNNLTFTGTGNRITGDFSNGTQSNRVMFQTSTSNGASVIGVLPNGTGTTAVFRAFNNSDPTNAAEISLFASSSSMSVISGITGTGTYQPLTFLTGGSERLRIDTSGNVGIGQTSPSCRLDLNRGSAGLLANFTDGVNTNFQIETASLLATIGPSAGSTGMAFKTGNTERMRIDSSGNVGIGTSSPGNNGLSVNKTSGTGAGIQMYQSGTEAFKVVTDNSAAYVQAIANIPMQFYTNNTERMRIDSSGNVGIGVTPSYKFHIKGSGSTSSTLSMYVQNSANTELFFIRDDGAIETGEASLSPYNNTTASAANMLVDSTGRLYRSTSSLKYKTDIQDATHGLAKVLQLRPVTYKGKAEKDKNTIFGGLIAEEVDAIGLTEFVQYAEDGSPDALAYGNMVSLLAKAIQEQQAMIETLKSEVALLKSK